MNKNIKKDDIIRNLSFTKGYSLNFSKKIVNDIIDILTKNIRSNKFNLKNIGTFRTILKNQRLGRNPKTKEEFVIDSRKSIKFTPSKKILEKLNRGM